MQNVLAILLPARLCHNAGTAASPLSARRHLAHGVDQLHAVQAMAAGLACVAEVLGHQFEAFVAAGYLVRVGRVEAVGESSPRISHGSIRSD